MTLAATVFVLGSMTLANAQTQVPGASSIQAQAQAQGQGQATTPIHKAACQLGALPTRTSLGLRPLTLRVRCLLVSNAESRKRPRRATTRLRRHATTAAAVFV